MAIFTHVTVGTNDLAKARAFYDAVLAPLGLKRLNDLGDNGSIWGAEAPEFFVLKPANGQPGPVKLAIDKFALGRCAAEMHVKSAIGAHLRAERHVHIEMADHAFSVAKALDCR